MLFLRMLRVWRHRRAVMLTLLLLLVTACAHPWTVDVVLDGGSLGAITPEGWNVLAQNFPGELRDKRSLPLERALYEMGVTSIETLTIGEASRPWAEVADAAWLRREGRIELNGTTQQAGLLNLASPAEASLATAHVADVAPTICQALGLAAPASSSGVALGAPAAERAVFIFLDGLGYRRYQAGRPRSLTPFLDSLGQPHLALTVYPSITRVVTAAFLTGAPPSVNGVQSRDVRETTSETLFDVLVANGMTAVAVEGDSLPFNMPNAEIVLSGDRDGNGHTDDNTFANALDVIHQGMPDLLWVHFHGIDDMGHTYGPDAVEVDMKMAEVDGYVRDLMDAIPEGTLVVIASDHGMHAVEADGRLGNHGTLQPDDMYVPLWVAMH